MRAEAAATIQAEIDPRHAREVGGVLIGHYERIGIVVNAAIPIKDRRATSHRYVRSEKGALEAIAAYLSERPGSIDGYVGEWHTHVADQPPSYVDHATMTSFARQMGDYLCLIVAASAGGSLRWHPVVFDALGDAHVVELEVLSVVR